MNISWSHLLKTGITFLMIFGMGTGTAMALDPLPKEPGFSGFFQPGGGYLRIKSNMVSSFSGIDLSDETISSLGDKPDAESTGMVSFPFKVAYTFDNLSTQVFLGTELFDLVRFDLVQQLGVKQDLGSMGIFQAGFLFNSIPPKVWKDSYVVNAKRSETDRDSKGIQLTLDKAFGSNFELEYTYRNIDIDSERSGEFLGLSGSDQNLLDRDSDFHRGVVRYHYKLAEKQFFIPSLAFVYDDRDGRAMRNYRYFFNFAYAYHGDPLSLVLSAGFGQSDYDKRNPIFGKTREDDNYTATAALYYKNPWGWTLFGSKPIQLALSGAYGLIDSNIDFYTEEVISLNAGLLFKW